MFRERSLSKLNSKSLSKIKNKIDLAFSKPTTNENKSKNQQSLMPSRSKSTKSLSKFKHQPVIESNVPFAIAIKSGLVQTDRKKMSFNTPVKQEKMEKDLRIEKEQSHTPIKNLIYCEKMLLNEYIKGFSWYNSKGKEVISDFKKSEDRSLRYFAIQTSGRKNKKIIAALEQNVIYVGSKDFMILKSNNCGLITKQQTEKVILKDCHFALVLNFNTVNYCNVNKLLVDVYSLISDGVTNLDVIANIIGRKITDSLAKDAARSGQEIFLLVILLQNILQKYKSSPYFPKFPMKPSK